MTPELEEYLKIDEETQQFLDEYEKSVPDRETQIIYDCIINERFKFHGMMSMQFEQGKEKEKIETALRMLTSGYPFIDISNITKLPISTIESLQSTP